MDLKSIRKAAGITQHELATLVGVKQPLVSKIEKRSANPSTEVAKCGKCSSKMRIAVDKEEKQMEISIRGNASEIAAILAVLKEAADENEVQRRDFDYLQHGIKACEAISANRECVKAYNGWSKFKDRIEALNK